MRKLAPEEQAKGIKNPKSCKARGQKKFWKVLQHPDVLSLRDKDSGFGPVAAGGAGLAD